MAWLFACASMDVRAYQPKVIERRFQACLRRLGVQSGLEARRLLESRPDLIQPTLDVALIGVSSFFRDPSVFGRLEAEVYARLSDLGRAIAVLSAGASEGQELYSLAILLDELGGLSGSDLLGIDCRSSAVAQARAGAFEDRKLEGLSASRRARYFERGEGMSIVRPLLRTWTRWQKADLFSFSDPRQFDIVLCRNLAIYLTPAKSRELWVNLDEHLLPGGLLVTGKAEKPPPELTLRALSPCLYRKLE